jgi:transcription elongation factor Elf1
VATWSFPYGIACPECNDPLIAPSGSEYVSEQEIRHFWSCENCGHQVEMVVDFGRRGVGVKPKPAVSEAGCPRFGHSRF